MLKCNIANFFRYIIYNGNSYFFKINFKYFAFMLYFNIILKFYLSILKYTIRFFRKFYNFLKIILGNINNYCFLFIFKFFIENL